MSNQDEKYVTIPFEVWERKYKPMEERVKRLERDLEAENIDIRLDYIHIYHGDSSRFATVGVYVNRVDYNGTRITWKEKEEIIESIKRSFKERIRYESVMWKEDLEIMLAKMEKETKKIKRIPAIIRWIFKIKLP